MFLIQIVVCLFENPVMLSFGLLILIDGDKCKPNDTNLVSVQQDITITRVSQVEDEKLIYIKNILTNTFILN